MGNTADITFITESIVLPPTDNISPRTLLTRIFGVSELTVSLLYIYYILTKYFTTCSAFPHTDKKQNLIE